MRRMLTLAGIGVALAACGGQSAQQAEQQRVARCQAEGLREAQAYVAPYADKISQAQVASLGQSNAQVCIDSPAKTP